MESNYLFFVALVLLSAAGSLILAFQAWRWRSTTGAMMIIFLLLAISWWAVTNVLECLWLDLAGKLFWARCKYLGIIPAPLLLLAFVLQYTGRGSWLQKKFLLPALVIPVTALIAVWTDPLHHLFFSDAYLEIVSGYPNLRTEHGLLFWIHTAYSYLALFLSLVLLAASAYRSPAPYRKQQIALLLAMLVPWGANAITILSNNPIRVIDMTPVAFSITGAVMYLAVNKLHLLDIVPIARQTVVENMADGMLVLNLENKILDVNSVLAGWLNRNPDQVIGHSLKEVFAEYTSPGAVSSLSEIEDSRKTVEIETAFQGLQQTFEVRSSPIHDRGGRATGRVLLLRDITEKKTIEHSLWQTKELLERIFNNTNLLVVYLDCDLRIVKVNRAFVERVKSTQEALVGKPFFELFPNEKEEQLYRAVLRSGEAYSTYADPNNIFDPRPVWPSFWNSTVQPVRSAAGEMDGLTLTLLDVTEREQANRALADALELNEHIISSSDIGILAYDSAGHCVLANDAAVKITRTPIEQMLWGNFHALESWKSAGLQEVAETVLTKGKPYRGTFQLDTGSDQKAWLDCYLTTFTSSGQTHLLLLCHDVTGLKTLENDLEEAKALLEQAFEQSPVPIVMLGMGGVIQLINPASRVTLKIEDPRRLIGVPIAQARLNWEVRDSEGRAIPRERWPLALALRGEMLNNAEYMLHFSDGDSRWVLINATPVRNKSGAQIAVLMVFVDITERKQIERAEREQRILAEAFRDTAAILNSTIQLDPVLTLVLTNIETVVPHDTASVVLFNEEGAVSRSKFRGLLGDERQQVLDLCLKVTEMADWRGNPMLPAPLIISDASRDPQWADRTSFTRLRSFLHVPIHFKDHIIGLITLASTVPNFFESIHAERLQVFADQAAIAIENARLYSEVQHLTLTDELTHIYNYRGLIELGQREFDRARRFNRPLSVLFYDIDHFREFNNDYSHAVGNQVLQAIAKIVRGCLRGVDIIARYGGEEFVILLPETELNSAVLVAERIRQEVAETYVLTRYGRLSVTISIGAAEISAEHNSLMTLIDRANQAEHRAKNEGRNRVSTL